MNTKVEKFRPPIRTLQDVLAEEITARRKQRWPNREDAAVALHIGMDELAAIEHGRYGINQANRGTLLRVAEKLGIAQAALYADVAFSLGDFDEFKENLKNYLDTQLAPYDVRLGKSECTGIAIGFLPKRVRAREVWGWFKTLQSVEVIRQWKESIAYVSEQVGASVFFINAPLLRRFDIVAMYQALSLETGEDLERPVIVVGRPRYGGWGYAFIAAYMHVQRRFAMREKSAIVETRFAPRAMQDIRVNPFKFNIPMAVAAVVEGLASLGAGFAGSLMFALGLRANSSLVTITGALVVVAGIWHLTSLRRKVC